MAGTSEVEVKETEEERIAREKEANILKEQQEKEIKQLLIGKWIGKGDQILIFHDDGSGSFQNKKGEVIAGEWLVEKINIGYKLVVAGKYFSNSEQLIEQAKNGRIYLNFIYYEKEL